MKDDWFNSLITDCKDIIGRSEFTSRWALVEGYHAFGKRILAEHDNFERSQIYGGEVVVRIAESVGKSQATVWKAIQFVKRYPNLKLLPGGDKMTWGTICNKLLPTPKDDDPEPLVEASFDEVKASVDLAIMLSDSLDHLSTLSVHEDALDYLSSQLKITAGKLGKFLLKNDRSKRKFSGVATQTQGQT